MRQILNLYLGVSWYLPTVTMYSDNENYPYGAKGVLQGVFNRLLTCF